MSVQPSALRMKGGVPPTARKARTGLFTPPTMSFWARSKMAADLEWFIGKVNLGLAARDRRWHGAILRSSLTPRRPASAGEKGARAAARCARRPETAHGSSWRRLRARDVLDPRRPARARARPR